MGGSKVKKRGGNSAAANEKKLNKDITKALSDLKFAMDKTMRSTPDKIYDESFDELLADVQLLQKPLRQLIKAQKPLTKACRASKLDRQEAFDKFGKVKRNNVD